MAKNKAEIGLIGLAVMGENLALNMLSKGFSVAVYNLETERVTNFVNGRAKGKKVTGTYSIEELVENLSRPRKIMLAIRAGSPVDSVIEQLIPLLDEGDIIIDGGNTHYPDTIRRTKLVESHKMLYVGSGVSGGEEGALLGPSLMPGGSPKAWEHIKPIFTAIAAKTKDGGVCADWVGEDGAGHFVKMVHNGIEYGDMQLITEIYDLMRKLLAMENDQISKVFKKWNKGMLESYLVEITSNILKFKDENGNFLVDFILDTAGQKGTGKWTAVESMTEGVPLTLIGESVYARFLSSMKEERGVASKTYESIKPEIKVVNRGKNKIIDHLENALYVAKILSYTQGYMLMQQSAKTHNWNLNYGGIAMLWREGCIIRSVFLEDIKKAYDKKPDLANLLLDDFFKEQVSSRINSLREVVSLAVANGIYVPTLASAITFFDGYTSGVLPHNLLQGMRDYFGAHTFERTDQPRGKFFHNNWTGKGGKTASTTYNV